MAFLNNTGYDGQLQATRTVMKNINRRVFLAAGAGAALALPALAQKEKWDPDAGVTAPEDLMKEHGVLRRCLLVYETGIEHIRRQQEIAPEIFSQTAGIIRKFVEDYHERNEEQYIFPEFERAKVQTDLVQTLKTQHQAGRKVTAQIQALATPDAFKNQASRENLAQSCRSFIRMYRPHAAREDSVLFVALRTILSPDQILKIGDRMEQDEKKVLGEGGFEHYVDQIAEIEKRLGTYELAQFTPKSSD